jgi:hypothetical protein
MNLSIPHYSKVLLPTKVNNLSRAYKLVNRFKLGSDPEFHVSGANTSSLRTGCAWGADMNGRLVEIRSIASRSSLRVTASILSTLRFFNRTPFGQCDWTCSSRLVGEGIGGHVHFGRKKKVLFSEEISALDSLNNLLLSTGILDPIDAKFRRSVGPYGRNSDTRPQNHGYEYRSFESWLSSPLTTFLVLTLSKLLVHSPIVLRSSDDLYSLLKKYKPIDDDARILLGALKLKGIPIDVGSTNFKSKWGLLPRKAEVFAVVPQSICPSDSTLRELFFHFASGLPLQCPTEDPPWKHYLLKGYVSLVDLVSTCGYIGLGELLVGLCCNVECVPSVSFESSRDNPRSFRIGVGRTLENKLQSNWKEKLLQLLPFREKVVFSTAGNSIIRLGAGFKTPSTIPFARRLLTSGVFPVWETEKVEVDSFSKWNVLNKPKPRDYRSKLLYEGTS